MANLKPNKLKIHLPAFSNCHICDLQTLTPLQTLESEWRIVLLCDQCLRLVNTAAKCSYCFSDFSDDERNRSLDCRQCSHRIHFDCVPIEQRFVSLSNLNLDSFICVDCCALPRFGGRNHPRSVLARVEIDPVVKDEELALQLHLAMNGSQRISRSGRIMSLDRFVKAKKVKKSDYCSRSGEKIGFCTKDEGLIGKEELNKENGMVVNSSKDNRKLGVWITYQRANKSRGAGSREKHSETEQRMNGGENLAELEQKSRCDPLDRYAKKYSKRKSRLKEVLNGESR